MTGNAEGLDDEGNGRLVRLGFVPCGCAPRLDVSAGLLLLLEVSTDLSHSEFPLSPLSLVCPILLFYFIPCL